MRSISLLTACALALAGCSSLPAAPRLVETPQLVLPPAPADVIVPREPNFLQRIQNFFSGSEPKPTASSISSPPAKP